jgi:AcrR family transcriptional regulator
MPKARRTQSERRETTRRVLIEHAMRMFAARGFEATTLADIAEAAGVSKGGVHHHFAAKRELVIPVFAGATASIRARVVDATVGVTAPWSRVRAAFEAARTIIDGKDEAALAWVECVIAARRDRELSAAIASERDGIARDLVRALRPEIDAAGLPWSEWAENAALALLGWAIGRVLRV